jgi:hypothetical protein
MRLVCVCALFLARLSLAGDITVVMDVRDSYSRTTFREMQREASQILGASGLQVAWLRRSEISGGAFANVVLVTFRGSCMFTPAPPIYDELGPLAITRSANGSAQPFGEVNCDRVVNSIRPAMFGADYAQGDVLLGRALGRVVVHELVHMLTKSDRHANDGVQRAALSGRELIAKSLPLDPSDLRLLAAATTP